MRKYINFRILSNQRSLILRWFALLLATVVVGTIAELFGLPGSHFFGGVIVGLCLAVFQLAKGNIPKIIFEGALAVTGVVLGTYLTPESLSSVGANIIPIVLISLGTLALSLGMGLLLTRITSITSPTALLGMLAGGSAMNVVTSDHIKADVRMVTFMHLIRLLLVLLVTPVLIHFFFAPTTHLSIFADTGPESASTFLLSFVFTIAVAIAGFILASKISYSGSILLTPLFLAAALMLLPTFRTVVPPEGFREFAAIIIGLQVGLRFNIDALRKAKKHAFVISMFMLVIVVGCGAFAWMLTKYTSMNSLTAYLATTPGGRTAVVALAFTTGADTTTVLTIQTLRLLIMTLLAPLVIRYMVRGHKEVGVVIEDEELLE